METFDYQTQFERIKRDAVDALTRALHLDGQYRQVRVGKVWVDDQADAGDWDAQHEAIRQDKTWGVPVYASLDLIDRQSGKVLSHTNRIKVATLPKGTELGTFLINGKHYQVHNQLRRKPGVYVTEKVNHDLKTDVHIAEKPFSIELDPGAGIFYVVRGQGRQPLYPLLSQMGVSDGAMARAWGPDLLAANKTWFPARHGQAVKKLGKSFLGKSFDSAEDAAKSVREELGKACLAPEVTRRTLGEPIDRVTPDVLVRGAEALLQVKRGERPVDDRQSIEFKKLLSVSDFLKERLLGEDGGFGKKLKEFRRRIEGRLNNRSNLPTQIGRVIQTNEFTPLFETFFTGTDLAHTPELTNPLHVLNGLSKVTIMGEGGVRSEHEIKDEERMVHPSHLGFLDPVHTPESSAIGAVMHLPIGAVKGPNNEIKTRVYDPKARIYLHLSPAEMGSRVVAFPDQFQGGKFIGKQVKASVGGDIRYVDADEVDAVLPSGKQAFSISTNSIPFLPSDHAVRGLMATKMLEQALPLVDREPPAVQVKFGPGTLEQHLGQGFSIRAKDDGVVEKVAPGRIHLKTKNGVVEQPLYQHLPLGAKSFLHATPRVKAGDAVKKGDLLADSNFTQGGTLALGKNLRAAYVPYLGWNVEDGIVVTESAAKKLTSEHLYQFGEDLGKGAEISGDQYAAQKPADLTHTQRAKLDTSGVVRKGQILHKGDALWVGVKDSATDPDSIVRSKLTKIPGKRAFKATWDNEVPGEVVDVVRNGGRLKVFVKALEPAQIGDKLTNRHGGKGIITKIIPDGEAPRDASGRPVEILLNPHGIGTRINAG